MERIWKKAAETKLKVPSYYLPMGPEKNNTPPAPHPPSRHRVKIIGVMDEPGSTWIQGTNFNFLEEIAKQFYL